jgi:curved DNA-binding protein CbpA
MHVERRNHYRILQVRSDAHVETITSSYKRLVTRLKLNPEQADGYTTAASLHEAYAVLSHPRRRSAYDARRSALRFPAYDAIKHASERRAESGNCHFCSEPAPSVIGIDSRCSSCDSPLAPVITTNPLSMPRRGRAHVRTPQSAFARLCLERGGPLYHAKLRDLSPGGLSLFCGKAPLEGSQVRVIAPKFDAVVQVVKVRADGPVSIMHARILTACYPSRAGIFAPAAT